MGEHAGSTGQTERTKQGPPGVRPPDGQETGTMSATNLQTQTITKSIRYPVPSATREGVKHTVIEDPTTGERICNCEANVHAKTRGRCWHLKAVAAGTIKPVVRCTVRPAPAPL